MCGEKIRALQKIFLKKILFVSVLTLSVDRILLIQNPLAIKYLIWE